MTNITVVSILTAPFLFAVTVGCLLLKRAFKLPKFIPEEFALAIAWVFIVGSLVWLGVFLKGATLLGFGTPWTWLTAAHFAFAGYGALTVTALCCRVVSNTKALKILRFLLVLHPVTYLITAAGILGFRYCDELAATAYEFIFITQLVAVVFGQANRIARPPRLLLFFALAVPVLALVPALFWAWGKPIFNITEMVKYHGIVNAVGHVGLGLLAFIWARPQPQLH